MNNNIEAFVLNKDHKCHQVPEVEEEEHEESMDIDEKPNVGKLRKVKQVITPNHLDN
jgi:hypothetical protein|tara:strand:- start:173 stop:343 length:171 start_codon:yes stop_codon:yes gene_type:complete